MEGLLLNRKEYTYLYTYLPTYLHRNQECCNNRHYLSTQSKQLKRYSTYPKDIVHVYNHNNSEISEVFINFGLAANSYFLIKG